MDREGVITKAQIAIVYGWKAGNTAEAHLRSEVLNLIIDKVVEGCDKTQIVGFVNKKRQSVGLDVRHIVDKAYKEIEGDL